MQLGTLVTGVVLGWLLGQDGRPTRIAVIAPPGERVPSLEEVGLISLGGERPTQLLSPRMEQFALEPIDENLNKDMRPRTASTTYYCERLLNAWVATKVLLILQSTCDQALTIQVVGHQGNNPADVNGLVNIGGTQNLAASGKLGLGIDLATDWYPYLGVTVAAGATPPTSGNVVVTAYGQRWVKRPQVTGGV